MDEISTGIIRRHGSRDLDVESSVESSQIERYADRYVDRLDKYGNATGYVIGNIINTKLGLKSSSEDFSSSLVLSSVSTDTQSTNISLKSLKNRSNSNETPFNHSSTSSSSIPSSPHLVKPSFDDNSSKSSLEVDKSSAKAADKSAMTGSQSPMTYLSLSDEDSDDDDNKHVTSYQSSDSNGNKLEDVAMSSSDEDDDEIQDSEEDEESQLIPVHDITDTHSRDRYMETTVNRKTINDKLVDYRLDIRLDSHDKHLDPQIIRFVDKTTQLRLARLKKRLTSVVEPLPISMKRYWYLVIYLLLFVLGTSIVVTIAVDAYDDD